VEDHALDALHRIERSNVKPNDLTIGKHRSAMKDKTPQAWLNALAMKDGVIWLGWVTLN
jgi:hypothetical protein